MFWYKSNTNVWTVSRPISLSPNPIIRYLFMKNKIDIYLIILKSIFCGIFIIIFILTNFELVWIYINYIIYKRNFISKLKFRLNNRMWTKGSRFASLVGSIYYFFKGARCSMLPLFCKLSKHHACLESLVKPMVACLVHRG